MNVCWMNKWNKFICVLGFHFLETMRCRDTESLLNFSKSTPVLASLKQLRHCWPIPSFLKSYFSWPPKDILTLLVFLLPLFAFASLLHLLFYLQLYIQFSYFYPLFRWPQPVRTSATSSIQISLTPVSPALACPFQPSVLPANRWTFFKHPPKLPIPELSMVSHFLQERVQIL